MSSIIDKVQNRTAAPDEHPRVLEVDDGESDAVLDALATDTRRALLRTLFDRPATPSEIADRIDTSVQNVNYHLGVLRETGLVEEIDTRYSAKGNEMSVYAPACDPIVFVGNEESLPRVKRSLSEIVGGLGLIGLASLLVQWGVERLLRPRAGTDVVGPASQTADSAVSNGLSWVVFEVIEPGVAFFFGCLLVATLVATLVGE